MNDCIATLKNAVMKPETILQSHVLDIIFDNRNKEYGAYALRKNYNKRLVQALSATFLLAGLFFLLQSMKPGNAGTSAPGYFDSVQLTTVILPPDEPIQRPKDDKPEQQRLPKDLQKTLVNVVPVIKPDVEVPETTVHTLDDLNTHRIGAKPSDGKEGDPYIVTPMEDDSPEPITLVEPEIPAGPLEIADVMPSFNGDIVKYMLRNIRQPDDLEPGDRIVVKVKFVVNEEGKIGDIQVMESGRPDLDKEVVRVIRMMPRWNPGKQAGRAVPVFFRMPVTFVSNAE